MTILFQLITILTLCLGVLFLFEKPKITTWLLIVFCIIDLGFFSRWFGAPRIIARVPFLLMGILAVKIVFDYLLRRHIDFNRLRILRTSLEFFILIILLTVVGDLYNDESLILGLYEQRGFFLFIILSISMYLYVPIKCTASGFVKPIAIVALLQLPFLVIQNIAVKVFGLSITHSTLDICSGTFSGYGPLVLFQCFAIGVILLYHLKYGTSLFFVNNYIVLLTIITSFLISNSRTAVAFVLMIMVFCLLKHIVSTRSFKTLLIVSIQIIIIPFFIISIFYTLFYEQNGYQDQLSIEYVQEYFLRDPMYRQNFAISRLEQDPRMGRARASVEAISLIADDPITLLIGKGSGAVSSALFLNKTGNFYQIFGALSGVGRTNFSKMLCGLGWIGVLSFLFFLLYMFLAAIRLKSLDNSSFCSDGWFALLCIILPFSFYSVVDFNITFLMFAYLVVFFQKSTLASFSQF